MEITAIQVQKNMAQEQKLMFQSQYENERKDPTTALILTVFGLHYFYLGKVGLGVLFWLTLGGFGIWWLIDLFRTKAMADEYNGRKAQEIAAIINGSSYPPQQTTATIYCTKCGSRISEDAAFCQKCGQPQKSVAIGAPDTNRPA